MRFWRKYSPEITVLGFLVTVFTLLLALNLGSVDWPVVVLVLVVILSLSCMVVAGSLWVRDAVERRKGKKAAREDEKAKEDSLVSVFKNASITALDLRRLYQAVKEEDVDIDDQSNERRQALVTRTLNIRKVFQDEFGFATPPLIDEKLESFNYQGWMDYLEELIVFMERGKLDGARQRFPLNQPWVPGRATSSG